MALVDPAPALDALFTGYDWRGYGPGRDRDRKNLLPEVIQAWRAVAQAQPGRALKWAGQLLPKERAGLTSDIAALFDRIAAEDPCRAICALRELKAVEVRAVATPLGDVWCRAADRELGRTFSCLASLPAAERLRIRPEILERWRRLAQESPRGAYDLLGRLDAAERAQVRDEGAALWPAWAAENPSAALSGLPQLRDRERLAVSTHVPAAWRALAGEDPEAALYRLHGLLPSERLAITRDVAEAWKHRMAGDPAVMLERMSRALQPEEKILLVAEIQDAWRAVSGDPYLQFRVLPDLPLSVRAGLVEDIRRAWWALAERGLGYAIEERRVLTLEERAGLPCTEAVRAFDAGAALPEGTEPEVEEDVRMLWRRLAPEAALAWLLRVKAGLRDLIPEAEIEECWVRRLEESPKAAEVWLDQAPRKLRPALGTDLLGRLLASEKSEVRLWAIARVSAQDGSRVPAKRTAAPPAGERRRGAAALSVSRPPGLS
jgi:hypothetical protein